MNQSSPMDSILGETRLERITTGTLAIATVVVGASIVADGNLARALNGVAGLTWFASSAMFIVEGRRRGSSSLQWAGITALTAVVAFVIKPSDIVLASIGFVPAAFVAGSMVKRDPMLWAKMIPALYLPLHIGTAVLKAAGRSALGMDASIRSEPPPTAAVVPFVMLAAAMVGGWTVTRMKARSR
ncbi:MAG: hypothetical protein M9953_11330 [Thermomicrobiales bacterium]|nr:hypothetical protein [Thermomicrobiales bacterium]